MRILSPWPKDLECAGHWTRSDRSARAFSLRLPLIMTPKFTKSPYVHAAFLATSFCACSSLKAGLSGSPNSSWLARGQGQGQGQQGQGTKRASGASLSASRNLHSGMKA
jgi:hypothetical protein